MDIAGLCDICNKGSRSLYTCWKCGSRVCEDCTDPAKMICIRCSKGRTWK